MHELQDSGGIGGFSPALPYFLTPLRRMGAFLGRWYQVTAVKMGFGAVVILRDCTPPQCFISFLISSALITRKEINA